MVNRYGWPFFCAMSFSTKIQTSQPEPPVALPGKITAITNQENRKERCSIFVNGEFLIGIDQSILLTYGFKKGDVIELHQWEELWEKEQQQKVFHWLVRRLETRAHGKEELRQKAKIKGYPDAWIDPALNKIERLHLLNDEAFAQSFASDKFRFKKWGPVKIRLELKKKGIADSVIKKVMLDFQEQVDLKDEILSLLKKRERHFSREADPRKRKQKMMTYLVGKGYPASAVMEILQRL